MSSPYENDGMGMIVKTVCGWIKGFILLYGIYVILYGHITPGGGFAGGVIAASGFLLVMLAEGRRSAAETFSRQRAAVFSSLGGSLFWLMAVLGVAVAGIFFTNFWGHFIEFCEAAIGFLVCSAVYLILTSLETMPCTPSADQKGDSFPGDCGSQ